MGAISKGVGFLSMMLTGVAGGGRHKIVGRRPIDWTAMPLPTLTGGELDPEYLTDKVVLAVNVASRCVFTRQYQGLEELWQSRREKDFVLLGIPSNDFANQEPGDASTIRGFCDARGIDFPMLAKQTVTGPEAHPLYRWAAEEGGSAAVPRWNFHKLLIGRNGSLVGSFASVVPASSKKLLAAMDEALATA
jgi:glutathione peroxidase